MQAMSRLNGTIKLIFLVGDSLLILLSVVVILLSSFALSDRYITFLGYLAIDNFKRYSLYAVVASSILFIASTLCGCCGSIRQVRREGVFSGRRILGLFQLCLVALFAVTASSMVAVNRRESLLLSALADPTAFRQNQQYHPFEKHLSILFNDAYFDAVCAGGISSFSSSSQSGPWLRVRDWIKNNCPPSPTIGRHEFCATDRRDLLQCNVSCEDRIAANGDASDSDSDLQCCSAETLCKIGVLDACPYQNCRPQVLEEATAWLGRLGLALRVVAILSSIMGALTCLLICYSPRDDIEAELYKAGVFTAADVENIKKLKQERLFTFDSRGSGSNKRTSINLDQLHERVTKVQSGLQGGVKRGRAAAMGAGARAKGRKHSKVSPNPSPASSVV